MFFFFTRITNYKGLEYENEYLKNKLQNECPYKMIVLLCVQVVPVQVALQRKKSLPDVQVPSNAPASITREEVSVLSSARREEIRRVEEENERLRANPLLYLTSPHMKVRLHWCLTTLDYDIIVKNVCAKPDRAIFGRNSHFQRYLIGEKIKRFVVEWTNRGKMYKNTSLRSFQKYDHYDNVYTF